jgi:TMEM175 potassium channel family protein
VAVLDGEEHSPRSLDRVVFFADAVFAIAITLLVVQITVPQVADSGLRHALGEQGWQFFSFALSFAVIGNWWIAHHRVFNHVVRVNERFLWLNLLFLMSIAFLPFPTAVLGKYSSTATATILYAGSLSAVGLIAGAIWIYASSGHRLISADVDERHIRYFRLRSFIVPLVFLTSIPLALVDPSTAQYWWGLVIPLIVLVTRRHSDA